MTDVEEYNQQKAGKTGKQHNVLPVWGNEQSMNLNPLILANIQGSSYFKVHLFKLKTYHEVVDEIYYQVKHLEPWERGSRKTAGQTGMCGGVRGVGAGGIVSTAFCLLYKLYTLRLTRKQLNGLLQHADSPYIRMLGFMYIRYTQPPADLFDWYAEYLYDEEEVDPRAGGGGPTTIGALVRQMMIKLDWFSTLFPRIPVPIQKQIEQKLAEHNRQNAPSIPPPQNNFNQREAGRGDNFRNDAAGGRGDNFRNDAGGGRGDNFRNDAGGGRGDNFRNDAGGGRGDNFRNDAGGRGSQGPALSGGNHYNPGRMDPDRREHDDRDRKDYAEDVNRYAKDRAKRDDRDRDRERGERERDRGDRDRGDRDRSHRDRDRGDRDRRDKPRQRSRSRDRLRRRSRSRDRRNR